jgi:hypothetical protein
MTPAAVKVRVDDWTRVAGISAGRSFRPVNKGDLQGQYYCYYVYYCRF